MEKKKASLEKHNHCFFKTKQNKTQLGTVIGDDVIQMTLGGGLLLNIMYTHDFFIFFFIMNT